MYTDFLRQLAFLFSTWVLLLLCVSEPSGHGLLGEPQQGVRLSRGRRAHRGAARVAAEEDSPQTATQGSASRHRGDSETGRVDETGL